MRSRRAARSRTRQKIQRALTWGIALGSLSYLLFVVITQGRSAGDQTSSILSGIVLMLSLLGLAAGYSPEPLPPLAADAAGHLREEVAGFWESEARKRDLLSTLFVPTPLHRRGDAPPTVEAPACWTAEDYMRQAVMLHVPGKATRAVIHGGPGYGKSTYAVMTTLGLLRRSGTKWLPLLLSLETWDPSADALPAWLEQRLNRIYESSRLLRPLGESTLLDRLATADGFEPVLILDDFDSLPPSTRKKALQQLAKTVPHDMHLVLLTRDKQSPADFDALPGARQFELLRPDPGRSARYLRAGATAPGAADTWRDVCEELNRPDETALAELLTVPLYLGLALSAAEEGELDPRRLLSIARQDGVQPGRDLLLDFQLDRALHQAGLRNERAAAKHLEFIAWSMQSREAHTLAWWRIHEAVPPAFLTAAATVPLLPAYWLCLSMPPGLTRGFAIGAVAGIFLGITRGLTFGIKETAAASALAALIVAAVGIFRFGAGHVVLADEAEIVSALALVTSGKRLLIGKLPYAIISIIGIGLVSATATDTVVAFCPIPEARGFISVALAVSLGVGVAVMSARMLTPVNQAMKPSRVELRSHPAGNPAPHLFFGILCAMAVGVGGAFAGGLTHGVAYGLRLAVVFGLIGGVPIGFVGGLIRWLNQPGVPRNPITASARASFWNDAFVAVGAMSLVGLASSMSIGLTLGPAHPLTFGLSGIGLAPIHGVLFGVTLGAIVATYNTAWPSYVIALLWFSVRHEAPPHLIEFLSACHDGGLLRQEGPLFRFSHDHLRQRLARRYINRPSVPSSPGSEHLCQVYCSISERQILCASKKDGGCYGSLWL
jgi:hypothetical protein